MKFSAIFCLVAAIFASEAGAELAKIRMTQHGLDYAAGIVKTMLQKEPNLQPGSNLGEEQNGKFKYSARLNYFTAPNLRVVSVAPNKLRFESNGGNVQIHFNGKWRQNRFLKASISGEATASSINLNLEVGLAVNGAGKLQLTPGHCSAGLGGLKIKVGKGILGKLVTAIIGLFDGYAKRWINSEVCKAMSKVIVEKGNPWLASADLAFALRDNAKLNLLLAKNPAMTPAYFDVFFDGAIKEGDATMPLEAAPIPETAVSANQVYFWLSDAATNGAFDFAHVKGLLQYKIDQSNLPEKEREKLRTTCDGGILPPQCIGAVLPRVAEMYPDTSIYFIVKSREAPTLTFDEGKATLQMKAEIAINVEKPQDAHVFKANLDFRGTVAVRVEQRGAQHVLIGELLPKSGAIQLEILQSEIGGIATSLVQAVVDFGEPILLAFFNQELRKGHALPNMPNMELVTPNLGFEKGALRVESSVIYKP